MSAAMSTCVCVCLCDCVYVCVTRLGIGKELR